MKCDICGVREAKVVVYFIGGEGQVKNKLFLCPACSQEVSISKVIGSNVQESVSSTKIFPLEEQEGEQCSFCQWRWEDFLKMGVMSCSHCYDFYSEEINNWLSQNQGGVYHRGKVPLHWWRQKKIQSAIFRLRRDLQNAIEQENYEKAGHLKQAIEKLRSRLK